MDYKIFGKKLKELRDLRNETREELALKLNVGVKQIQRYESGELLPTHENLNSLIGHYSFDFTRLIYDLESPPRENRDNSNFAERLLKEKEARRQETEARLEKADREKDRLFNLLETGMMKLWENQDLILAHEKAWFDYHAEEVSKGDKTKEKAVKAKLSRLVGERQLGQLPKDKNPTQGRKGKD